MFALIPDDFAGRILDCAGGPASFNAEITPEGHEVVSCDPLYRFSSQEIQARIEATRDILVGNAREARNEFVWCDIQSPEHLGEVRMAAMQRFLADFPGGLREGRYRAQALPDLDFPNDAFTLALCSHFLFTYSDQLSLDFHVASIEEMCRVAGEARVFPLLKSYGGLSPHVGPVIEALGEREYFVQTQRVDYEFQRGGNQFLRVCRRSPD